MLATALKPYGGIVMWRAFVYAPSSDDRAKQAYNEFLPLDGQFMDNVIVQVKNGPVDFQPREPYSPLFTAMKHTDLMVEFQLTQEYLGHSNHLAYLPPMWTEFFEDVCPRSLRAVCAVSNVGDNVNWCGHDLAQSNSLLWKSPIYQSILCHDCRRTTFGAPPTRPSLRLA